MSRVIQAADAATRRADAAMAYSERSNRLLHGLYTDQREALEALARRVDALEAKGSS